ncbi:MAG: dicarboxylate/amino acid:cation symporter, partial [Chlamydiae bacterium]|nr:dicarboxylate/amino acid:cation symporter [Chlamydiota bacterium]
MINFWVRSPLYLRIIGAVVIGLVFGILLGKDAALLSIPAKLILRLLGTIAPPLILLAIVQALVHAQLREGQAARLAKALILNTIVAISIGLFVANFIKPGSWSHFARSPQEQATSIYQGPVTQFLDNIPKSILGPFTDDGKVIGVIIIALAFGVAFRR